MKIFKSIVIFALPFLLIVNLYHFIVLQDGDTVLFGRFIDYFGTFNGFEMVKQTIVDIRDYAVLVASGIDEGNILSILSGTFWVLFNAFSIPIKAILDIVNILIWLFGLFGEVI